MVAHVPQLTRLTPPLRTVNLELTNRCNLDCVMCPREDDRPIMQLYDAKTLIRRLGQLRSLRMVSLGFAGETLTLPPRTLEYIVKYARPRIPMLRLNTNGMLIPKHLEALLKFDLVIVSVDGFSDTTEPKRRGANYEQIMSNICLLLGERDGPTPRVEIGYTVTDQPCAAIAQFINEWSPVVDGIRVHPCVENMRWSPASTRWFSRARVRRFCTSSFGFLGILSTGDVVPCCRDLRGVNVLGNVFATSIRDVWKSRALKRHRRACVTHRFAGSYPLCARCYLWPWSYTFHGGSKV